MKTLVKIKNKNGTILFVDERIWDFRESCPVTLSRNSFWAQISPNDETGFVVERSECEEVI
jgi:hypothetical protein